MRPLNGDYLGSGEGTREQPCRGAAHTPNEQFMFTQTVPLSQGHIGQKKAIIAVSRKLLKMIYILLEKGQYYDLNYAVKATE